MEGSELETVLLVGTLVLLVAVAAVRVSVRVGLPSLLLYLGLGVALGTAGFGVEPRTAQGLGLTALALILAEGGLTTRWRAVRPAMPIAAVLATVGVAVSVALTAVAARLLLDLDWRIAVVLGAVVSSTDAAAVFSQLRRLRLQPRVVGVLEAESGLNDAPVVILVVLLTTETNVAPWMIGLTIGYELVVGAAVGLAVGWVAANLLRRSALPSAGLYPVSALAFALLSYASAQGLHASGFLAVYLTGLYLGNASLPHRRATVGFAEGIAWLAQIGLFVMLGLLVEPARLVDALLPALGVGLALLLVSRPLSVLVATAPFRLPWREQAFLAWSGLRGAVPVVLATIPLTAGVPGGQRLFDVVFVLVVIFTLVQAPVLAPLARRLGLTAEGEARDLAVEAAPLEDLHADLLQVRVPPGSHLAGVEVWELRLPEGASLTLVVRDGASFVPVRDTRLRTGDQLLVVASDGSRDAAEARLRAVSADGKLAGWRVQVPAGPSRAERRRRARPGTLRRVGPQTSTSGSGSTEPRSG